MAIWAWVHLKNVCLYKNKFVRTMMRLFNANSFSIFLFILWMFLSPLNCQLNLQLISLDFARFCNFYNVVTDRRTDDICIINYNQLYVLRKMKANKWSFNGLSWCQKNWQKSLQNSGSRLVVQSHYPLVVLRPNLFLKSFCDDADQSSLNK